MKLQESGEMYLENILRLSMTKKEVHAIDISEFSGYSKPSVSRAVGILKDGGYITVDPDTKVIKLTKEGTKVATKIYERHVVLSRLLKDLGVCEETATEDACKMEHVISDESFAAIKNHMKDMHEGLLDDTEKLLD